MSKIKIILAIALVMSLLVFALTSCNYTMIDLHYNFDYAYIYNFDGTVIKEGRITSWKDYEDGEQLQITFDDGEVWLTNSFRCDLIDK